MLFLPFVTSVESAVLELNLRNVVVEYVVKTALEMSHAVPMAWGFIGRDCKIPAKFDGVVPANASEVTADAIACFSPCEIVTKAAFGEPMGSIDKSGTNAFVFRCLSAEALDDLSHQSQFLMVWF